MDTDAPTLNADTVSSVFKSSFKHSNSKLNKEALHLSCEFLRLFTVEALHRASEEQDRIESSISEDYNGTTSKKELQVEHLERVLPQLLLDF